MGVKTVTEGIETQAHYNLVKDIGCDYAQGYYINKPMNAGDFEGLLGNVY
jgi:EAL domain-containing protein (putative c-di-GMP-specific phosphodiesterase class I)